MKRALSFILIVLFSFVYIGGSFAEEIVGTGESFSATKISALSAESRLKMLAIKRKAERETGGCLSIGAGCLSIALGAAYAGQSTTSSDPFGGTHTVDNGPTVVAFVGIGLLLIVAGIVSENMLTPIETNYQQISMMSNSTGAEKRERETISATFLKERSDGAYTSRMVNSALNLGLGAVFLSNSQNLIGNQIVGATCVGTGVIGFFIKSDVENEYEEYIKQKYATSEGAAN
jgi:hypothetical protein